MSVEIIKDDESIVIDTDSYPAERSIAIHEIGHCLCAANLGYHAEMVFDVLNRNFRTSWCPKDSIPEIQKLEEYATIYLGGHIAERICGIETGGFLNDQLQLFEAIRDIHKMTGMDFPYTRVLEIPFEIYKPYHSKGVKIIMAAGGKEALEGYADQLLSKIHSSR